MNKKRIRQMNAVLLRRLMKRPAADHFAQRQEFLQALEQENYMQRLAPLLGEERVQCGQVLALSSHGIDNHTADYDIVRKMRASILVLGPMLAR